MKTTTKQKPRTILISRSEKFAAAAGLMGALVFAAGCDNTPQQTAAPEPQTADPVRETLVAEIERRVTDIVLAAEQQTRMTTIETAAGDFPLRESIPRDVPVEVGTWEQDRALFQPTPGTVRHRFAPEVAPGAFVIADDGTLVFGAEGAVQVLAPGAAEPEQLRQSSVYALQWNADGSRLLLSGPELREVITWPERELVEDFSPIAAEPGRMAWAPAEAAGEGPPYWLMQDRVSFNASDPLRIVWTVRAYDPETETLDVVTDARPLGFLGTVPSLRQSWGVLAERNKIVPDRGAIWFLDNETLGLDTRATGAEEHIDTDLSADETGRLYFLRSPRLVDGQYVRTTRAWTSAPDDAESMLTAEPTYGLALSPNGQTVALLVMRQGAPAFVTTPAAALSARDLTPQREAERRFHENIAGALEELRAAFAAAAPEGVPPIADNPQDQEPWPDADLVQAMGDALGAILEERFGLRAEGLGGLAALDEFFAESDGLWPEEPATILGIAGLYADALSGRGEIAWMLATSTPALGNDVTAFIAGDELYTLHGIFYLARERLAGRAPLKETAVDLLSNWREPIVLTENYRRSTVQALMAAELARLGFDFEAPQFPQLRDLALEHPQNAIVNYLARESAALEYERAVQALTALNVAMQRPAEADVILEAARALNPFSVQDAQLRLYRLAEELAPADPEVWLASGEAHLTAWQPDDAEERLTRAMKLDESGVVDELAADALDLLDELRAELNPDS